MIEGKSVFMRGAGLTSSALVGRLVEYNRSPLTTISLEIRKDKGLPPITVDQILVPPVVDRLPPDHEVGGHLRDRSRGRDQVQDLASELQWILLGMPPSLRVMA